MKTLLCLVLSLFFLTNLLHAQTPATGAYAFASFDTPGFDSINLGNLNTRFTIPIVSRPGRGQAFNYSLQYEGLIWTNASGTWVPDPTWGFRGVLNGSGFTGYLTYTDLWVTCSGPSGNHGGHDDVYTNVVYHDAFGGSHSFDYTYDTSDCPDDDQPPPSVSGSGASNDGSGYTLLDLGDIKTRSGTLIRPSLAPTGGYPMSMTDRNGNTISGTGSGTFTDTLGATALSVSGSNPVSFTYPVTEQINGSTTVTANLSYQAHTVRTNFGCSGIGEYGSTSISLPYRLTLADGSYYEFSYEGTYQATDGAVTGRLASVKLPTGGTISYSYQYGCGAGINADGTVGSLTRTTSDGTRLYGRAPINGNATRTTLQDEKGNQSLISFTIDAGTQNFYETHRLVYQGSSTGSLLLDRSTCYNGVVFDCDGDAVALPISQKDVFESYNEASQTLTQNLYDTNGTLLTQSDVYSGALLTRTVMSYNSLGEVTSVTKLDGNNTQYAYSSFNYDEGTPTPTSGLPQRTATSGPRGNFTSSHIFADSTTLSTSTTYYDTGMPASTTAMDGGQTTYTYDSTGAFVTGTALPIPLSGVALATSASYDANSAAMLSSTGMNSGETTSVNKYDALLRPIDITTPSGSHIWSDQNAATASHSMVYQTLDSSRTAANETLLDGYGRVSRRGEYNGASTNAWNQVDYCYDASGLLQFQSAAYQSTGEEDGNGNPTPKHCSGAGTAYQYDALGRVTSMTTPDGTSTKQYYGTSVKSVDVNGVGKITQYDSLGRLSSVCELSGTAIAGGSPTDCGLSIAGTGYLTTYSYSLASHLTQINQAGQVRYFLTDSAGRTTYVIEPESGVTSYTYGYNATGLFVQRTRPKANQYSGAVYTNTGMQYDRLGRISTVGYDDGITPPRYFLYDAATSLGWSVAPSNVRGRLVATISGSNVWSQYTYDVAGRVLSLWQCAPSICGTSYQEGRPALQFSYDAAGALMSEYDGTSGNIVYGRSVAEQLTSVTNQSYTDPTNTPNLVTNVVNGPFGITNWHMGNGLSAVQSYDSFGRVNGGWICNGNSADGQSAYCANSAQLHGYTLSTSGNRVTTMCDTAVQCQTHGYDEFGRLTSVAGTSANLSWSYDLWGNRLSQMGSPSVAYSYNSANNQNTSFSYDAAGNQLNDAVHSYTYDAEGKVLAVDGGATAQYTYDALGQRVRTTAGGSTYEYLYDVFGRRMSSFLVTGTGSGTGNEGRIYWDYGLLANRAWNGGTYLHHADWLGTERMRTDSQGNVANQQKSNAFGDGFTQTSSDVFGAAQDSNQFTSQEQDAESGTIHFQYRQYSSVQGRWLSPDPYRGSYRWKDPQSFNRYAYARNSPFSRRDASGLAATCSTEEDFANYENCGDDDSGGGGGGGDTYDPTDCNDPHVTCVSTGDPGPEPTDPGPCMAAVCGYDPMVPPPPASDPPTTDPSQNLANNPSQGGCMVVNGKTVCPSPLDNQINPLHGPINPNGASPNHYRDNNPTCSTHVVQDPVTGQTEWHYDTYNPKYFPMSHLFVDVLRAFGPAGTGCY